MPFSHHSHSGQFCSHATDSLEEVVQRAISKKMSTLCLTEHMGREEIDFYPSEGEHHTESSLAKVYDDFYLEARRLQAAYADQIQLFVGFEGEWIRESSLRLIEDLLHRYPVDLFVGSVHHVHTVPIDYDMAQYQKARAISGGTDEQIFSEYFDSQLDMLRALKPPVVGHFDLIRLKSDDPNLSFKTWPHVWQKIERNLTFVAAYGGVLELNSSSLRKGMTEAYPGIEICKAFDNMGGRFTLSDDSHGVDQVGLNYGKVVRNVIHAGISNLYYLVPSQNAARSHDSRFRTVSWEPISIGDVEKHPFFQV